MGCSWQISLSKPHSHRFRCNRSWGVGLFLNSPPPPAQGITAWLWTASLNSPSWTSPMRLYCRCVFASYRHASPHSWGPRSSWDAHANVYANHWYFYIYSQEEPLPLSLTPDVQVYCPTCPSSRRELSDSWTITPELQLKIVGEGVPQ